MVALFTQAPDPTGVDDTVALQAAITGLPNGGTLAFPTPAIYKISGTLYIAGGLGRTFRSFGRPDSGTLGNRGCELQWIGAGGSDSMVFFGERDSSIIGLAFSPDANNTPPTCSLRIDDSNAPGLPTLPHVTCTGAIVRECLFIHPTSASGVTTYVHLDIGRWSPTNVDLGSVEHCNFNGGANGVLVGGSFELKGWSITRCTFGGCNTGIQFLAGSGCIRDCSFTNTGPFVPPGAFPPNPPITDASGGDIFFNALVDFCLIEGVNSESCGGLALWINSSGTPAEARNCRWSNMSGPAAVFARVGPALKLLDCEFQSGSEIPLFLPASRSASGIIMENVISTGPTVAYIPNLAGGIRSGFQQFGLVKVNTSTGF